MQHFKLSRAFSKYKLGKILYYQWFELNNNNAIDLKHDVHFNLKKK